MEISFWIRFPSVALLVLGNYNVEEVSEDGGDLFSEVLSVGGGGRVLIEQVEVWAGIGYVVVVQHGYGTSHEGLDEAGHWVDRLAEAHCEIVKVAVAIGNKGLALKNNKLNKYKFPSLFKNFDN